ncbi:MAG: citrate lyase holo-[acyl-carrier protein] synthase [Treponema sp.]|nr:MAG: citrate lyase holo-[acyl-carrier protein] synthase [Treponema sp.]
MKTTLNKLLQDREDRDAFENNLLKKHQDITLVTVKSNYPGAHKNTIESHLIAYTIFLEVIKLLDVESIHSTMTSEGLIFFIASKMNAKEIKTITTNCEDTHALGRLADIDVRTNFKIYSRADFNILPRKCFLCDNDAVLCVRNRTHKLCDVLEFIDNKVYKAMFQNAVNENKTVVLANISTAALLEELCRPLGFGCVTVNSSGSHSDMNFLMMLQCFPIIKKAVMELKQNHIENFFSLREYGKVFEAKIFNLTNSVNTYKGALFLLLILNACVLLCDDFSKLSNTIADFCKPLSEDFKNLKCSEVSLESFNKYGEYGIRGEALNGFENHFKTYLPMLENKTPMEKIILKIIFDTHDTTTIKRGGYKKLEEIRKMAKKANTPEEIKELNDFCVANNLSTGGTADKIIVLYSLYLIKHFYYNS